MTKRKGRTPFIVCLLIVTQIFSLLFLLHWLFPFSCISKYPSLLYIYFSSLSSQLCLHLSSLSSHLCLQLLDYGYDGSLNYFIDGQITRARDQMACIICYFLRVQVINIAYLFPSNHFLSDVQIKMLLLPTRIIPPRKL